jgi:hypothetical protein
MLKIVGTESAKHVVETPEGNTTLPEEFFLAVQDTAGNDYLLTVGITTYETVKDLLHTIKENQLSFRASA